MNRSALQGASATVALLVGGLGLGSPAWAATGSDTETIQRVRQHVQMLKENRPPAKAVRKSATAKSALRLAAYSPDELAAEQAAEALEEMAEPTIVEVPVEMETDMDPAPDMAEAVPEPAPVPPPPPIAQAEPAPPPAPKAEEKQVVTASAEVPPQQEMPGVLTRRGTLVIEPSIEYAHTDVNQFSFGGVAILDTVLVGAIEANQANRDAVTATLGLRYGITNRMEGELRFPYMYRSDSSTNTFVNQSNTAQRTDLSDHGLGDIEGALHYQLNDGMEKWPIMVANLRVKSTTGTGPYDVSRNNLGIEQELATGSGFWGVEPSLTFIAPSDPAVFYANLGYLWNAQSDINKQIGNRTVNSVDPGDAVRMGVGMGLALNEKVSFTIGYQHDWIMKSKTKFADGEVSSSSLSVGSMTFGVNWQMSDTTALNVSVGVGVTNDSPDVRLMARVPIALNLF
ncbi:MAG: transporter [Rhodospirillaceae bacterium]|nr:transporter [Rhodospirillales bacterium]